MQGGFFADDKDTVHAWIDGASSGNPGPAGAGVVIKKGGKILCEHKVSLGITTNNVAEYSALLVAMEKALELGIHSLVVHTDSELLYRQLAGRYKVRNPGILKLYTGVQELKRKFSMLRVQHVPRELNREADRLARQARES